MSTLSKSHVHRETFDPANQAHLDSFDNFLLTGNWGSIQFFTELPYTDVPMTVLMKFAFWNRGVGRETDAQRADRLSTIPNLIRMPKSETLDEVKASKQNQRVSRGKAFKVNLKANATA